MNAVYFLMGLIIGFFIGYQYCKSLWIKMITPFEKLIYDSVLNYKVKSERPV